MHYFGRYVVRYPDGYPFKFIKTSSFCIITCTARNNVLKYAKLPSLVVKCIVNDGKFMLANLQILYIFLSRSGFLESPHGSRLLNRTTANKYNRGVKGNSKFKLIFKSLRARGLWSPSRSSKRQISIIIL